MLSINCGWLGWGPFGGKIWVMAAQVLYVMNVVPATCMSIFCVLKYVFTSIPKCASDVVWPSTKAECMALNSEEDNRLGTIATLVVPAVYMLYNIAINNIRARRCVADIFPSGPP